MKNIMKRMATLLLCAALFPGVLSVTTAAEETESESVGEFTNNFIPFNENTDLIVTEGKNQLVSLDSHMYPDETDISNGNTWKGARLTAADTGDSLSEACFTIHYKDFCQRNSITHLNGDKTKYVVLKIRADDDVDITFDFHGRIHYRHALDEMTWNYCGIGGDPYLDMKPLTGNGTQGVKYVAFYTADKLKEDWELLELRFNLKNMSWDDEIYVEELSFFADSEELYAYTGLTVDDIRFDSDHAPVPDFEFTNARIPFNADTAMIPKEGFYRTWNLSKDLYPSKYDTDLWEGARLMRVVDVFPEYDGAEDLASRFKIMYENFCVRKEIKPLPLVQARYLVLSYKVEGEIKGIEVEALHYSKKINDDIQIPATLLNQAPIAGDGTEDTRYLVFDLGDVSSFDGSIRYLHVEIDGLEEGEKLYLTEMALFATADEMCAYTGLSPEDIGTETEPETEPETESAEEKETVDITDDTTDGTTDHNTDVTAEVTIDSDESDKRGCTSAVGFGAAAILTAVAAAVALKKPKNE